MSLDIVLSDIKRVGDSCYQGKANDVWETDNPEVLEIVMTDRVSAGNGEKRSTIPGKGRANCAISKAIFKRLEVAGIHPSMSVRLSPSSSKSLADSLQREAFVEDSCFRKTFLSTSLSSSLPSSAMKKAIRRFWIARF